MKPKKGGAPTQGPAKSGSASSIKQESQDKKPVSTRKSRGDSKGEEAAPTITPKVTAPKEKRISEAKVTKIDEEDTTPLLKKEKTSVVVAPAPAEAPDSQTIDVWSDVADLLNNAEERRLARGKELRAACFFVFAIFMFASGFLLGYGMSEFSDEDEGESGMHKKPLLRFVMTHTKALEVWLLTPADEVSCEDGLFIAGPTRTPLNAGLTLFYLLWCFVGIAIGSDVFMGAIEAVTSAETKKTITMGGRKETRTIPVWNATVANLTLMALGSSAPEILLSVIEISSSGFFAGELGPSTIVGSAAFNLLIIIAVCVTALPPGDGRLIKARLVFYVTAVFSVLSYVWLLVILQYNTPNIVDVWEAAVTLFAFPVLVWLAYKAEVVGSIRCPTKHAAANVRALTFSSIGTTMTSANAPRRTRAFYRANAVRGATGKRTMRSDGGDSRRGSVFPMPTARDDVIMIDIETNIAFFEATDEYAQIAILRTGKLDEQAMVAYTCSEPQAPGNDGVVTSVSFASGYLLFEKFQRVVYVQIKLTEADLDFSKPSGPRFHLGLVDTPGVTLGTNKVCGVGRQWDENFSGVFTPSSGNTMHVKEKDGKAKVTLVRQGGLDREVSVHVATKSLTAVGGRDFEEIDEELVFAPGEHKKTVEVIVNDDDQYENDENFQLIFSELSAGVFSSLCDGGPQRAIVTVYIENSTNHVATMWERITIDCLHCNFDDLALTCENWAEQWKDSLTYEPGGGVVGAIVFMLSLPWKVFFALSPPPRMWGGVACFLVSLGLIGLTTAVIGDLAANLGCCFGITKSITAITFVALGTSLPDTFASRTAAVDEDCADASIGNVTGSNSVNVLLGLGMPWLAAAVYWNFFGTGREDEWRARYMHEPWYSADMPVAFAVPAGDLGYSVSVFSSCALVCLGTILLRRAVLGFELGGPSPTADLVTALFFVGLWVFYIYMSVLNTMG